MGWHVNTIDLDIECQAGRPIHPSFLGFKVERLASCKLCQSPVKQNSLLHSTAMSGDL